MNRTFFVTLLALVASSPLQAQSISAYDGTILIPGAGENARLWTALHSGVSVQGQIAQQIQLKSVLTPYLGNGSASVQADYLRSILSGTGGVQVLVAHSFGGIVARKTYQGSSANIAGIITIATPHNGTWAANNLSQINGYIGTLSYRLYEAATYAFGAFIGHLINDVLRQPGLDGMQQMVMSSLGASTPITADASVGSATVTNNWSYAGDASLPRASVQGTIPVGNFPFRLLASSLDTIPGTYTFEDWVHIRNAVLSALKVCRIIGYGTIINWEEGRKCSFAKDMLVRLDRSLYAFETGQSYGSAVIRNFDGLVDETRGTYPGLSDPNRLLVASGPADHLGVVFKPAGISATTTAMLRIGMPSVNQPPPSPSVHIMGQGSIAPYAQCSWSASTENLEGTPSFAWQVGGQPVGDDSDQLVYGSSSPPFTIKVTATGSNGSASDSLVVALDPQGWCQ